MSFGTRIRFDYDAAYRIASALGHVSRGGLPVQPAVLKTAKTKLFENLYGSSSALVDDLKADFALILHCLKVMVTRPEDRGGDFGPLRILKSTSLADFQALIPASPSVVSKHRRDLSSIAQHIQMQVAAMSLRAVELIAAEAGMDAEAAYGVQLLRQAGPSLLAWNYPRIFFQALSSTKRGFGTLDENLRRCFGFASSSLVSSLLREWRLGTDILRATQAFSRRPIPLRPEVENPKVRKGLYTVDSLCEAAEILACSADPAIFPGIDREWEQSRDYLSDYTDAAKLDEIREVVTADYQRRMPKKPRKSKVVYYRDPEPARKGKNLEAEKSDEPSCDIASVGIEHFMREVLPEWGFKGGCVYGIEGEALIPTFLVGKAVVQYEPVSSVIVTEQTRHLIDALLTDVPFCCLDTFVFNRWVSFICGKIGDPPAALLYLEMGAELKTSGTDCQLRWFAAAQKTLAEIMQISSK